jgi:hypothetical protein
MGRSAQCIFCGTDNGAEDRFCRLCRSPLRSLTAPAIAAPTPVDPVVASDRRNRLAAVVIAVSLVLLASATALGARGPLLDLASHIVPAFGQSTPAGAVGPARTALPANNAAPEHGAAATCHPGNSEVHGQGLAKGQDVAPCPTATPKPHGPADRTPAPKNPPGQTAPKAQPHATSTPAARGQGPSAARGNGGTQAEAANP